ncbi:MAG: polysaccharide deacetylase family protein [Candidatus Saccharibacteria bacterium]|nr:polysaccharide deacetylase family protein [Candidatus Saccharibacteria bacterium]
MASDIIAAEAKTGKENVECDFCAELVEQIRQEEEAAKAAERAKKLAEARGVIYLTFDDGPGDFTNALLDILDKYEVKATFFVTGRGDDAVIRREDEEGHTVALHTWSHNYAYIYANTNNYFADLSQVAERVKNITGKDIKLVRFPGGSSNLVSRRYDGKTKIMTTLSRELEARGYQYFDWNVDSDDAGRANSSDTVYTNVVTHLKDGPNVVLQHDIKPYSVEAVERIIQYGNENNFVFDKLELDSPTVHHSLNN